MLVSLVLNFFLINSLLDNQDKTDLLFIRQSNPIKITEKQKIAKFTLEEVSEFKLMSMGLIRLYQIFISSQDMPVCNFSQSCSHFSMESIKKYGVVYGILMTADRLQRCNGYGRKYYPVDLETNLAKDYPVETYYLFANLNKKIDKLDEGK